MEFVIFGLGVAAGAVLATAYWTQQMAAASRRFDQMVDLVDRANTQSRECLAQTDRVMRINTELIEELERRDS